MSRVLTSVSRVPGSEPATRAELAEADFHYIRALLYEHAGIALGAHKREMVQGRLAKRMRELCLPDLSAYCARLRADTHAELPALVNALTTNLTYFFREPHHFEALARDILPPLLRNRHTRRLRIWSAGCSTGEEPYSIAITLHELLQGQTWDAKILATDIDTQVLARAQAGVYADERLEGVSPERLTRCFLHGHSAQSSSVKLRPEIQNLVTFRHLNLMASWPMQGPFDVIFCRNVLIYFDADTQNRIAGRFHQMLAPGGHLLIGHSESLSALAGHFEALGKTIYRKRETQDG
jgi:chemotaxis protein methyltransferase CheR